MPGHTFRPFGHGHAGVLSPEDGRHDVSCFADEVIIDFPSVAPAVERMRRGFLGDDRPTSISAAIRLARRDALLGTTVPLEVPVRCTCSRCGGRGESWAERCARCLGRGCEELRHVVQVTIPAGVSNGARYAFTVTPRHSPPTRVELSIEVSVTGD
jgi:hypothetical protein